MVILHYLWDDERCVSIMPNMKEIPWNLYLDFANSWELDIWDMSLPKKWKGICWFRWFGKVTKTSWWVNWTWEKNKRKKGRTESKKNRQKLKN